MSSRGKKNYKNLNFNTKEDYLYAGYVLIVRTYSALKKYKYYKDMLEKYQGEILKAQTPYIENYIYEEWSDKESSVAHTLLTCFVDDTPTGFSYIMFRKLLQRSKFANVLSVLSEENKKDLDELRDVRNWTFHFAQSDIVAMREAIFRGIPSESQKYVTFRPAPIIVGKPILASALLIDSLKHHMNHRIKVYEKLFNCMINDYEGLLGEKVSIQEAIESPREFKDLSFDIAQLSMAMQKKKYDGTRESYEKVTLRNLLHSE